MRLERLAGRIMLLWGWRRAVLAIAAGFLLQYKLFPDGIGLKVGGDSAQGEALGRAWVVGDANGLQRPPSALRPLFGLVRLAERWLATPRG